MTLSTLPMLAVRRTRVICELRNGPCSYIGILSLRKYQYLWRSGEHYKTACHCKIKFSTILTDSVKQLAWRNFIYDIWESRSTAEAKPRFFKGVGGGRSVSNRGFSPDCHVPFHGMSLRKKAYKVKGTLRSPLVRPCALSLRSTYQLTLQVSRKTLWDEAGLKSFTNIMVKISLIAANYVSFCILTTKVLPNFFSFNRQGLVSFAFRLSDCHPRSQGLFP